MTVLCFKQFHVHWYRSRSKYEPPLCFCSERHRFIVHCRLVIKSERFGKRVEFTFSLLRNLLIISININLINDSLYSVHTKPTLLCIIIIIIIIRVFCPRAGPSLHAQEPRLQPSTANSGTKAAVLLGIE